MSEATDRRPHVVIIGGGFGGLNCAKALRRAEVRVTLVDRTNHHLFQPLLYQVATAGLSPAEIAMPIRSVLRDQKNATVLLDEVTSINVKDKRLLMKRGVLDYDYLVIAAGATNNYFGKEAWREYAPGMKTLDEAVEIRRRVLLAFEQAEREKDPKKREALMTMVVIGGGPTGVEMAGALSEIARTVLSSDFRTIDPRSARVILIEGSDRVLSPFPVDLSLSAQEQLKELGVELMLEKRVTRIDPSGVYLGSEKIASSTVVWAAGVKAAPVTQTTGVKLDRMGRIVVQSDLTVEGAPGVYAIGDVASFTQDGATLPGLSPVAIQQASAAAENIVRAMDGLSGKAFKYRDKGIMATIGRSRAVAKSGPIEMKGMLAWLAWLFVHVLFLIGFRNRFVVMFSWAWSYLTFNRGSRLITGERMDAGAPPPDHDDDVDGDMPSSSVRAQQVAAR